ncbi:UNVERIFIED_CONTAM: hypothetical protein Sradi_0796400 [Sesamum radiatum]|uniref:Uncharacterized protein n=1 Tax=Sesamum radiatum TaxID=300843 RepID=A0AAW2VQ44_SESRA
MVAKCYVRRHSLPASTNGKLSSLSPRIQKPVQANGKGGGKTNRSMSSSRDDKVLQPLEEVRMWLLLIPEMLEACSNDLAAELRVVLVQGLM